MNTMKFPFGIQSFEKLREGGLAYVDKTARIHELASTGGCYFLSRPEGFGKTLLLSAMKAFFSARKELFEGLALSALETEWAERPVFYLNLDYDDYTEGSSLRKRLGLALDEWEKTWGAGAPETSLRQRFENVVRGAFDKTGRRVAILVDECTKPLYDTIDRKELQDKHYDVLKDFYSVLKTQDERIHFAFLAGVSGLNTVRSFTLPGNVRDITSDKRYADLCGITEEELSSDFDAGIKALADENGMTGEETVAKLGELYGGYRFVIGQAGVYNPKSLVHALDAKEFGENWFSNRLPAYLFQFMGAGRYELDEWSKWCHGMDVDKAVVDAEELADVSIDVHLLQNGYMTLKEFVNVKGKGEDPYYTCVVPNMEVKNKIRSFGTNGNNEKYQWDAGMNYIKFGQPEELMEAIKALYIAMKRDMPNTKAEQFLFTTNVQFRMYGCKPEDLGTGKIVTSERFRYVIEFATRGTVEEALARARNYYYPADGKKTYIIGAVLSSKLYDVMRWKISE